MPMKYNHEFQIADPTELIEFLKRNPDVLGILQYGSGVWPDAADTDICVVVARRPEGLESVHFWIGCGPVDMNVRTLDELRDRDMAELPGFDDVLRDGKVLYEKQPGLLADIVSEKPSQPEAPDLVGIRHGHAHVLHKLEHYKDTDALLCNVLLAGATHWLLGAYTVARGMPYRGEKATLKAIRQNDRELLPDLEKLASGSVSIAQRIGTLCRLTDKILEPVGGPWQKGEVLFFAESVKTRRAIDKWQGFFASLMKVEKNSQQERDNE